jgi:hypothetical protein
MLLANKNFPLVGPSRTALLGTLAALVFAANCAGAPGTVAITGMTTSASAPGGFISVGANMWVTDAALGLCQVAGGKLTNCVLPPTSSLLVHAVLGQPAFDAATGFAYVPDMGTASKGIWRYHFNGKVFDTPFNLAATAGLGAQRPGAVTLGDEVAPNLYASMTTNASYVRVNLPATAAQTVDKMGTTVSGSSARGLAFVGPQLWIADSGPNADGISVLPAAATCGTKCRPTINPQIGVPGPLSIAFDSVNSYAYIGTSFGVFRYNLLDGQTVLYSKYWVAGVNSGLMTNVNAVGVDSVGTLYYVNDPTASQAVGAATGYTVALNSPADGLGPLGSPPATIQPFISTAPAFANYATLYSTGLTTPKGAVFMGTHVWVVDTTLGFCKVDTTQPAPSLTSCAVLPVGFVPGGPAYDKVNHFVYLPDTTAAGAGIMRLPYAVATETVGLATTFMANTALVAAVAGSTAPTALAVDSNGLLYAAMAGTNQILRVNPAAKAPAPKVATIGNMFDPGSLNIAFHNNDLWAVEKASLSIIYGATLCQGNCVQLFFPQAMQTPPLAVTSDGVNVYIGDGQKVFLFDPVANVLSTMADTGLIAGVATAFSNIAGLALDGQGHLFAADAGPMWQFSTAGAAGGGSPATITSITPVQAPEGSTTPVTITGTNFVAAGLVVSTCASGAVVPGNVTVVSPTQILATFTTNPVGPIGACNITVTTTGGVSAPSAGSIFTVLIGPAALTSVTPNSGFRGHAAVPVVIAGANMGLGTINPIAGITISNTVINAAGTQTTANFLISGTAALGPQNLSMNTPSGQSNILPFTINAAPPVLTSISPAFGAAGTVAITLTGTDLFGATINPPAGFTVNPAPAPVVTATSITATLSIATTVLAGPQSITVTGPGGISNPMTFTVLPGLTSIAVSSARSGAVTTVTLTGTSLAGVTTVNAGANIVVSNVAATAGIVTATFTSALAAPLGPQSVTVTDINGTSNAVTFTLTASVPVLNTIAPNTATSFGTGSTVAITLSGTGLAGSALNLPVGITLSAGSLVSTFSTVTANIVIAGNAPLGLQNIGVTTAGGISNTVSITVFPLAPLLNTIAPTTSAAGATITVTLTGTGFAGTTSVNTVPGAGITATIVSVTATQVTAQFVIAASATTQQISVTNLNGTSNSVTFGIVPTLTSISPASNPAGLTVPVTLTGTSLTGATSINAGAGITATIVSVVSSTQINASFVITAAAAQGNRNITVTTPGGTTGAVVFNVLPPPPTITSINSPFTRSATVNNQGVSVGGATLATATSITAVKVFRNGIAIPIVVSANPVAGSIIVSSGTYVAAATQLKWNWTMPTSLPVSSGTNVYTMTVTTPSGTSAPFGFTVQ